MKILPFSLADNLKEQSRIFRLFDGSNLMADVKKRVLDGSLYLPPVGHKLTSVYLSHTGGLAQGFQGQFHSLTIGAHSEWFDENREEMKEGYLDESIYVSIPVSLVDSYTVTTEYYGHRAYKLTREVMTFSYSKRAFAAWVRKERARLRASRKEELTKARDKLNTQIKALL